MAKKQNASKAKESIEYNGYVIRVITNPCIIAIPKDAACFYKGVNKDAKKKEMESAADEVKTFIDSKNALEE